MTETDVKIPKKHIPVRFKKETIDALWEKCLADLGKSSREELEESGEFSRWYRKEVETKILPNHGKKQRKYIRNAENSKSKSGNH